MTLRIAELLVEIDDRAPIMSAAEWDSVGLQIGDPDRRVSSVAVVHEITPGVLPTVFEAGVELIITYHPLLFRPLASVISRPGAEGRAYALLRQGIGVIAVHTNWDAADGGTCDALAEALGITDAEPFSTVESVAAVPIPIGRLGTAGVTVGELAELAGIALGTSVRVAGSRERDAGRVALLPGSGGSLVGEAIEAGANTYLTGDVSHHQARSAAECGLAVVDAGHAPTERPGVKALYHFISQVVDDPVDLTGIDDEPWE